MEELISLHTLYREEGWAGKFPLGFLWRIPTTRLLSHRKTWGIGHYMKQLMKRRRCWSVKDVYRVSEKMLPLGNVVNAQPRLEATTEKFMQPSWALVRPPVVVTAPACAGPRWRAPLDMHVYCVRAELWVLSLSRWRKVGLPFVLWQEYGPNFKGLPKVSGVATNHWVFLRCDWSPISSWFYYRS